VKLAYFDQHSHVLESARDAAGRQRRVIDLVQEAASSVEIEGSVLSASQLLERFLFPPAQQHQPVSRLSGGERRRLHLCRLLIGAPNVLLLDEPTNDLDVQTLTVLEDFLEDFRGCVVVVSHDRYFLDRTVDRLFVVRSGRLERFEGNYSAYLDQRRAADQATLPPPPASPAAAGAAPGSASGAGGGIRARRRSYGEQRELTRLEQELPQWEEQRRQLEALLAAGGSDYTVLEQLTRDLAALSERIGAGEERWLELSDLTG
jgi:ATP-binding cassette subfamily F protein uup